MPPTSLPLGHKYAPRLSAPQRPHLHLLAAPRPDERLGQAAAAHLEGPPLTAAALAPVQALLAARPGPHKRPRHWVFVPAFIGTANGKLDRRTTQAAA